MIEYGAVILSTILIQVAVDLYNGSFKRLLKQSIESYILGFSFQGPPIIYNKSHMKSNRLIQMLVYGEMYLYDGVDTTTQPPKPNQITVKPTVIKLDTVSMETDEQSITTISSVNMLRTDIPTSGYMFFRVVDGDIVESDPNNCTHCAKSVDIIRSFISMSI